MTTETKKANNTKTNAPSVFAPLGKYAVIAVIMVSIIVTTAIMLDKQLNTVERNLATIESEVAAMHTAQTETTAEVENNESISTSTPITTLSVTATAEKEQTTDTIVAEAENTAPQTLTTNNTQATPKENHNAKQEISANVDFTTTETTTATMQTPVNKQAQFAMNNREQEFKNRIATYKAEQKQRMTDMFARIRALEAQQLDKYKANQDKQIARLRNQVTNQQEMIETLVSRNKDLFEYRAANVQRIQTNRESVLNRI